MRKKTPLISPRIEHRSLMLTEICPLSHLVLFLSFDRLYLPADVFAGGSVGCQLLDDLVDGFQSSRDGSEINSVIKV